MTGDQYRRMKLTDMQRLRWRTTRELRTGMMTVPAGTEVQIVSKRNGLDVSAAACSACGVSVYVRKVFPSDVEEVLTDAPA